MNSDQIVIDTSCIIAVVLGEPVGQTIIKVTANAELVAPASLRWEIGNSLSAMFKRKRLDLAEATEAVRLFELMTIQLMDVPLSRAVEIASAYGIYAYDAYMIACAEMAAAPLASIDAGLIRVARSAGAKIVEI